MNYTIDNNASLLEYHATLRALIHDDTYLKKVLANPDCQKLNAAKRLTEKQRNYIKLRGTSVGKTSSMLNGIITGCFGAWLGMGGFVGFSLNSLIVLYALLTICFTLGGFVGYFNVRIINNQINSAVENLQLSNVKLKLSRVFSKKIYRYLIREKDKLFLVSEQLYNLSQSLDLEQIDFKPINEDIFFALDNLQNYIDLRVGALDFGKLKMHAFLEHIIHYNPELKNNVYQYEKNKVKKKRNLAVQAAYPAIFSKSKVRPIIEIKRMSKWMNENYLNLLINLFPTVCGTFGSMFVFLSGGVSIARDLHAVAIASALKSQMGITIGLTSAIFITAYYGYSQIAFGYNQHRRDAEMDILKVKITAENEKQALYKDELLLISNLRENFQNIFSYLKKHR